MADKIFDVDVIVKHGTKASFAGKNPVLKKGELGIETDGGAMKLGDGSTEWNNLAYIAAGNEWQTVVGSTRAGTAAFTLAGDQRTRFPRGKLLRFNSSDAYICRVFGDPTYASGETTVAVWFDTADTEIPAAISVLERHTFHPMATASAAPLSGGADAATITKLIQSYCCSMYITD
ncbi:hypothetical protein [Cloacibacillus evryensis]|uniref:hyaluronate lyase N-terminal domain-containing protein n=1 Tax=Cloacibacillus evryensis TaxID=508460 RepID=UPI00210B45B4|nr:hypothetical protein [Cloacibacillus evryensis]MCQ4765084.1 hypothetical protein [Cloacibacillus evryensis]